MKTLTRQQLGQHLLALGCTIPGCYLIPSISSTHALVMHLPARGNPNQIGHITLARINYDDMPLSQRQHITQQIQAPDIQIWRTIDNVQIHP